MEWTQIVTFAFQAVITALIGLVGWGITNAMKEIKAAISELKEKAEKSEVKIDAVEKDLNNLKADLPLVFTLRDDFIRVMNNFETKLDKLIISKKEG